MCAWALSSGAEALPNSTHELFRGVGAAACIVHTADVAGIPAIGDLCGPVGKSHPFGAIRVEGRLIHDRVPAAAAGRTTRGRPNPDGLLSERGLIKNW